MATITFEEILQAVGVLSQTDRGRAVMKDVLNMLDEHGVGLDTPGQKAVITLLRATWGEFTGSARDEMRAALSGEG